MADKALAGIRVLELGPYVALPLTGRILASMGAEVIKVESHSAIDVLRTLGPSLDEDHPLETMYMANVARNQLGVLLALRTEQGQAIAHRAVCGAHDKSNCVGLYFGFLFLRDV